MKVTYWLLRLLTKMKKDPRRSVAGFRSRRRRPRRRRRGFFAAAGENGVFLRGILTPTLVVLNGSHAGFYGV